jgi:hypothetical protein
VGLHNDQAAEVEGTQSAVCDGALEAELVGNLLNSERTSTLSENLTENG